MPETKTIVASVVIGVHCEHRSVPRRTDKGAVIDGEFAFVHLRQVPPGEPVTIEVSEADALIARGVAKAIDTGEDAQPAPKGNR